MLTYYLNIMICSFNFNKYDVVIDGLMMMMMMMMMMRKHKIRSNMKGFLRDG